MLCVLQGGKMHEMMKAHCHLATFMWLFVPLEVQFWEPFILSFLHKFPCSSCCHHLLALTLEIITFIFFGGVALFLLFTLLFWNYCCAAIFSLSRLHLCIPLAPAHLNFLDVAPTERSARLQLCNKLLSVSSLCSAKNINFHQRGVV